MNNNSLKIIKSIIVILIAFLINYILMYIDKKLIEFPRAVYYYNPLIVSIVGVFGIANKKSEQKRLSLNLFFYFIVTLLLLTLNNYLLALLTNNEWFLHIVEDLFNLFSFYSMTLIGIIVLLLVMALLKKKEYSLMVIFLYLTMTFTNFINTADLYVIFYSNTISIIFGLALGYSINMFHLSRHKHKEYLMIYDITNIKEVDEFVNYEINDLLRKKANIMLYTCDSPAQISENISQLDLNLPVMVMNGAAIFNFNNKHYEAVITIDENIVSELLSFFRKLKVSPFINAIKNDMHYLYVKEVTNVEEIIYADNRKNSAFLNLIIGSITETNVCSIELILLKAKAVNVLNDLKTLAIYDDITVISYDKYSSSGSDVEYTFIKIYASNILNNKYLTRNFLDKKKLVFTNELNTKGLFDASDYIVTTSLASIDLQNKANFVCPNKNKHALIKQMKKMYYRKSSY